MIFVRIIIIVTVVVSITDIVAFYHIKNHPERLTTSFVIGVIIITIIPIVINLWWHLFK
jgi:dynactin complex subunit